MAACSAISRTRSATGRGSMLVAQTLVCDLSYSGPQTKVCATVAQKKKWAKTHRIMHPTIRASCGLYEKDRAEASAGQGSSCPDLTAFRVPTSVGFFLTNKSPTEVSTLNTAYQSTRPLGEEAPNSHCALCRANRAGQGLAAGAYASSSFCALKPGLITASFWVQS